MSYPAVIASFYVSITFSYASSIVIKFIYFLFSSCLVIANAKADPCLPHCSIEYIFW